MTGDADEHGCLSCAIVAGRVDAPGGAVAETDHLHVRQDVAYPVAYPVPGQMIVAARRHVRGLANLSDAEASKLPPLLQRVRRARGGALGVEHVHCFRNEDTRRRFHIWMVPRHPWMAAFGRSIASVRPALSQARDATSSPEDLAAVREAADRLRRGSEQADRSERTAGAPSRGRKDGTPRGPT